MTLATRALECRLGAGRIALATDVIASLGEYVVGTRLPHTRPLEVSIGVWGAELVFSISLSAREPAARRATAGALLARGPSARRWALEIDAPLGFVEIATLGPPVPSARWQRNATLRDGRSVLYVDAPELLRIADGAGATGAA